MRSRSYVSHDDRSVTSKRSVTSRQTTHTSRSRVNYSNRPPIRGDDRSIDPNFYSGRSHAVDDRSVSSFQHSHRGSYAPVAPDDRSVYSTNKSMNSRRNSGRGGYGSKRGSGYVSDDRSRASQYVPRQNTHRSGHNIPDDRSVQSRTSRSQFSRKVYNPSDDQSVQSMNMNKSIHSKQQDERSVYSTNKSVNSNQPNANNNVVSNERLALSMAIQHHSHKLMENDIDINDVWNMDDPLDDGTNAVAQKRKVFSSDAKQDSAQASGFMDYFDCCPSLQHKRYFLSVESKRIRIILFIISIALSSTVAYYFGDGSFGTMAAKLFNNEPLITQTEDDKGVKDSSEYGEEGENAFDDDSTKIGENLPEMNIILPPLIELNLAENTMQMVKKDTAFFWQVCI